jgi:hypothetical protein
MTETHSSTVRRPPRRRLRTAAAAVAATAAVLALAACGSEVADDATTPAATVTTPVVTAPTVPPASTPTVTAPPVETPTTTPATTPDAAPVTTGPDVEDARGVIQAYIDAFVAADGQRACDHLTAESQQAFLDAVQGQVTASTCADAFTQVAQQVPQDQREAFGAANITDLTIVGDSASGVLTVQGISNGFTLVRVAGVWKIANLPGS